MFAVGLTNSSVIPRTVLYPMPSPDFFWMALLKLQAFSFAEPLEVLPPDFAHPEGVLE